MSRGKMRGFASACIRVGIASVFFIASSGTVSAAEFSNIGGHPANPDPKVPRSKSIFIHTLEPGQTVKDAVKVVNYTTETKTLEIYATDSLISSGGAFGCAQKVESAKSVGGWIELSSSQVTLKPNTEKVVPFSITAPLTANVGGNDGCIVIQEKNGPVQEIERAGGSVSLSFRTAIRVALLVPGDIVKRLSIVNYQALTQPNGDIILQSKIKNEGNVSVDATLITHTHNISGLQKNTNQQEFPILRGATTHWNAEFERPFWGGLITSRFAATYDANTENTLGAQNDKAIKTLESETIRFISWPRPLALAIELGVLLALVLATLSARQKLQQRRWVAAHWRLYTIKSGDTIMSLAQHFGVSWKLLAKTNKLKPPYSLRAGDKLKVPPRKHR